MSDVTIEVLILHSTPNAVLVALDDESEGAWIPRSVANLDPEDATKGDVCCVTIPEKMATEKGLL